MTDDESPQVQKAIDVLAQYALWRITDEEDVLHEDFPELGEYDFERLTEAVSRILPVCPDLWERQQATEYLAKRADHGVGVVDQ